MSCLFCRIIQKEIPSEPVLETEDFIVINDIHPEAPVHLLIIPKEHHEEFLDMPAHLLASLMAIAKTVIKTQNISAYRLINNGKGAADIDHFHLHILGKIAKGKTL